MYRLLVSYDLLTDLLCPLTNPGDRDFTPEVYIEERHFHPSDICHRGLPV